jgi:aromatic-L-amino-acid decarboxylase
MSTPLALDDKEFRRLGHQVVDLIADHLARVAGRPVFTPMPAAARSALRERTLPEHGASPDALLAELAERVLPYPMGNGHPRFFGWVNSPPAPVGILADFLAAALDPSCAGGDHAAIYVERAAVRWLMELIGFPTEGSMGLLVSGGSTASLTALAAARHRAATADGWDVRAEGLQGGRPPLTLYTSEEGHSCIRKATELLGLGGNALRTVPTDADFRMDVAALRQAIARDRAAGRRPFCVAASAGTVSTGAVDPLDALADVCEVEGLWLHVDGAYGAPGVLDPTLAPRYAGLGRAHSVALDPHKWLSVPVECGCILVRDGVTLRNAFSLVPPYLRTDEGRGFGGPPWYSEYGFQQTRGFRALVSRHAALARELATLVERAPDLELAHAPTLSIVCFRYAPEHLRGDEAALEALNKRVMEEVQARGAAFLTGTTLRGRFTLRACILHYATTEDDLRALIEAVRAAGAALTSRP